MQLSLHRQAWAGLAIAASLIASPALAQQSTFYDARGSVVGHANTTAGTSTSRTTTFYDAQGRNVGSVSTPRQR
jgi:hypothetical protein